MPERALAIAEGIYVTITNIGSTAKSVEPVLRGIAPRAPGDTERYVSLLPLVPFIDGPPIRQFRIPSESWLKQYPEDTLPEGVYRNMGGSVVVCWHAPWRGRIAKLKIQGDDGVRLIDLGGRGLLAAAEQRLASGRAISAAAIHRLPRGLCRAKHRVRLFESGPRGEDRRD